ncbi:hypothetical protein J6590_008770 [Homalodisca vitripennis]|nr:hypothetical protein J6590_008770 [Homalodisca vitripennis]
MYKHCKTVNIVRAKLVLTVCQDRVTRPRERGRDEDLTRNNSNRDITVTVGTGSCLISRGLVPTNHAKARHVGHRLTVNGNCCADVSAFGNCFRFFSPFGIPRLRMLPDNVRNYEKDGAPW